MIRFNRSDHDLTIGAHRDGLDRYFHQATGVVGGRQPADSSDRLSGRDQPADPAVSETVEYGRQRHHRLSRCVGRSDSGLHHDADRAGRRLRRRRRLHDLVFGARHQHHPGLHQAEFRSEPGADRSPRQGEFGQIPHSEGIQRSGRDQDHRPDHGRDVSRLLQRSAVGIGDIGLSDAGGSAGAFDRRWRRFRRYSGRPDLCDAAVARSRPHGRPQRFARRRFRRDRRQQFPGRRRPGQGLFHRLQRHRPIPICRTSISSSA